jgi:hypothetical protein
MEQANAGSVYKVSLFLLTPYYLTFYTQSIMASAPVSLDDFEQHARKVLPPSVFGYYYSGADAEWTMDRNKKAYDR